MRVKSLFSVLPDSIAEILQQAKKDNNTALHDFIAIFDERLYALSQQVFMKTQSAQYESYQAFKHLLMHMSGCYQTNYLAYISLFASSVRSAAHLKLLLESYFDLPFSIREFQPLWQKRTRISSLGHLRIPNRIGVRVCSHSQYFKTMIGPLTYAEYLTLLPGSLKFIAIVECIRAFVGSSYHFNIILTLPRSEIPPCCLSKLNSTALGINTWLRQLKPQVPSAEICGWSHAAIMS